MIGQTINLGVAEVKISTTFKEEIVVVKEQDFYLKVTPDIKVSPAKLTEFNRDAFKVGVAQFVKRNANLVKAGHIKVKL